MTPKQQERIRNKIKKIKAALAADKRFWGGYYHDGQGLRYAPPRLYIQLEDYTGGLRYFNWFNKNFPDDACYPELLFEWTIILYKTGRLKEAAQKALETYNQDVYFFDKFFERPIVPKGISEGSRLMAVDYAKTQISYSSKDEKLKDFAEWLDAFSASPEANPSTY